MKGVYSSPGKDTCIYIHILIYIHICKYRWYINKYEDVLSIH
jgi:hypothetical protein